MGDSSGTAVSLAQTEKRPLLDADTINQLPPKSTYTVPANALITPLARQAALERHIRLQESSVAETAVPLSNNLTIAIGADHGGVALKDALKKMLAIKSPDFKIVDCGTYGTDSVDYPDFAYAVAQLVSSGRAWRGIIIDGAGIGSCMAANKVPGVRAAMCYDQATAVNSREHNNANVLTLGAGLIGTSLAQQIVQTWLQTDFGGNRHARRVDKIMAIEKRFNK
ncbi:MAG: ribose 5-phosphate isomerase B [Chloroflexi bacterium]|nr:ribose 5-phosphate isomerase B [Chloroflexota bacterium]